VKPSKSLKFTDCFNGLECARLDVPLDWTAKDRDGGKRAAIAVVRRPAKVLVTDPRYGGPVLVNPGEIPSVYLENYRLRVVKVGLEDLVFRWQHFQEQYFKGLSILQKNRHLVYLMATASTLTLLGLILVGLAKARHQPAVFQIKCQWEHGTSKRELKDLHIQMNHLLAHGADRLVWHKAVPGDWEMRRMKDWVLDGT
jgi:hypothetical protein